jgi:DNA polymerase-3 subunit delta'
MSFSELIGQQKVKERLGAALSGDPGHAYLFTGPAGIGKKSFARAFAQALLCENPDDAGACGHCASCRYFERGIHADYRVLELADKEKNIKVERVRQQVCSDLSMHPQFGQRKVYLIDADSLNEQGQNTLLKSLEEPPDYVVFILLATGPERLLPTVLSRVVNIAMQRYGEAELVEILKQAGHSEADRLSFFVRYANGLPGSAIELAGSANYVDLRNDTAELFFSLAGRSRTSLLTDGYSYFDDQRESTGLIFDIFASLIRDQLVLARLNDADQLVNHDLANRLKAHMPAGSACEKLWRCNDLIVKADRALALNASYEGLICNLLLSLRKELTNA